VFDETKKDLGGNIFRFGRPADVRQHIPVYARQVQVVQLSERVAVASAGSIHEVVFCRRIWRRRQLDRWGAGISRHNFRRLPAVAADAAA
jgi:hypothetical protein